MSRTFGHKHKSTRRVRGRLVQLRRAHNSAYRTAVRSQMVEITTNGTFNGLVERNMRKLWWY